MSRTEIILEFIKIILSWPVITLASIIILVANFKEPISEFLMRIVEADVPGLGKIRAKNPDVQQRETEEGEDKTDLKNRDKAIEIMKENPEEAVDEYIEVWNAYIYEKAFNLIYGTQIELLEHLSSLGTGWESYRNLTSFYDKHTQLIEEPPNEMKDYLKFLADKNFLETKEEDGEIKVRITDVGVNFLSYIKNQYPTTWRYQPY